MDKLEINQKIKYSNCGCEHVEFIVSGFKWFGTTTILTRVDDVCCRNCNNVLYANLNIVHIKTKDLLKYLKEVDKVEEEQKPEEKVEETEEPKEEEKVEETEEPKEE